MKVKAPNNTVWTVRRLLVPDWLRPGLPSINVPAYDVLVGGGGASRVSAELNLFGFIGGISLAAAVVLVAPIVVPAAYAYRRAFRRPWWIEARSHEDTKRWRVVGWDESRDAVEKIAEALARGELDPRPPGAEPVAYWGKAKDMLDETGQGFYARKR